MMKSFIITIDTEGDNLWSWKNGDSIATENTRYLQRFQDLCNRFGFQPTWLSNYEMIEDLRYVEFISKVEQSGTGELGMHLHAWNNPPHYDLPIVQGGAPYLIEYPTDIMEEKIALLTERIKERTGITPVSHRAGRWAMNDIYFKLLQKYGYLVDCSVTPLMNWSSSVGQSANAVGSDYTAADPKPHFVEGTGILELPVTVLRSHHWFMPSTLSPRGLAAAARNTLKGQTLWLRPNGRNLKQMLYLADRVKASDAGYLMFMIHSSEFMPGGSPTFRTEADIEGLYADLEALFAHLSKSYEGITMREYANKIKGGLT